MDFTGLTTQSKLVLDVLIDLQNLSSSVSDTTQRKEEVVVSPLYSAANYLYSLLDSPKVVAMARIHALQNDMELFSGEGLSNPIVYHLLKPAVHDFLSMINDDQIVLDKSTLDSLALVSLASRKETKTLNRVLDLYLRLIQLDITLAEELIKVGSHIILSKVIYLDSTAITQNIYGAKDNYNREEIDIIEQDEDVLTEIQDQACEIVHDMRLPHLTFPVKVSPFTNEELILRLPLEFHVHSPYYQSTKEAVNPETKLVVPSCMSFLVQQVTDRQSAQDDVGFVMWPSAVVLSSWLLAHPHVLFRKEILELGSGCGLTGLVASKIAHTMKMQSLINGMSEEKKIDTRLVGAGIEKQRHEVLLTDFNTKVLQNLDRNIALNELNSVVKTDQLDFYVQQGDNYMGGWVSGSGNTKRSPVDLILAADVICKPSDSVAASKTVHDALRPGGEAIFVSANAEHRFGIDIFENECKQSGLIVEVIDVADLCEGKLLPQTEKCEDPCGIRKTSGFVDGMSMTMFRIRKPNKQQM